MTLRSATRIVGALSALALSATAAWSQQPPGFSPQPAPEIPFEGKKLVERVPHLGARVANFSRTGLEEILFVREALEGMACRLATERMSDGEIDDLQTLLETHAQQNALKSGESYFQRPGDYDFHYRIITASGNTKRPDCPSAAIRLRTSAVSRPLASNNRRSKFDEIWMSIDGESVAWTSRTS